LAISLFHKTINDIIKPSNNFIASVKSQGIIGDKYVQLSFGGTEQVSDENAGTTETESAIDIKSLFSQSAFGHAK
jgi:phospholipid/cholesterol/gamma-HCH transport system substrate-binding protein